MITDDPDGSTTRTRSASNNGTGGNGDVVSGNGNDANGGNRMPPRQRPRRRARGRGVYVPPSQRRGASRGNRRAPRKPRGRDANAFADDDDARASRVRGGGMTASVTTEDDHEYQQPHTVAEQPHSSEQVRPTSHAPHSHSAYLPCQYEDDEDEFESRRDARRPHRSGSSHSGSRGGDEWVSEKIKYKSKSKNRSETRSDVRLARGQAPGNLRGFGSKSAESSPVRVRRSPNAPPQSARKYAKAKREDSAAHQRGPAAAKANGNGRRRDRKHSALRKHGNDPSFVSTGGFSSQEGSSQSSSGSGGGGFGFDGGSSSQGSGGGGVVDDLLVFDDGRGRRGVKPPPPRAKEALQPKPPRGPDGSALFALFSAHEKAKANHGGGDNGGGDEASPSMRRRGGGDDKHNALRVDSKSEQQQPKRTAPLSSAEKLHEQWRALDKHYAKLLRALRKKRQAGQGQGRSADRHASASASASIKKLQSEARATRGKIQKVFLALVLGDPQFALRKHFDTKIWALHYGRVESYIRRLRGQSPGQPADASLLDDLLGGLNNAKNFYSTLITKLKEREATLNEERERELQRQLDGEDDDDEDEDENGSDGEDDDETGGGTGSREDDDEDGHYKDETVVGIGSHGEEKATGSSLPTVAVADEASSPPRRLQQQGRRGRRGGGRKKPLTAAEFLASRTAASATGHRRDEEVDASGVSRANRGGGGRSGRESVVADGGGGGGGGGDDVDLSADPLSAVRTLLCLAFCALGDIERYREKFISKSGEWRMVAECYSAALNVDPGYGKAHNQLAVVAGYVDDEFSRLYHFVRAVRSTRAFRARENLLQVFEKSRQNEAACTVDRERNDYRRGPSPPILPPTHRFLTRFAVLQGMIYERIGLERFDAVLADLQRDLQEVPFFDDTTLLKLALICIHSVEHAVDELASKATGATGLAAQQGALNRMFGVAPPSDADAAELGDADVRRRRASAMTNANSVGVKSMGLLCDIFAKAIEWSMVPSASVVVDGGMSGGGNEPSLRHIAPISLVAMYLADRSQTLDSLSVVQRPSTRRASLFSPEQPIGGSGGITRASHMDNYEFWCRFTDFVNVVSTMPYESLPQTIPNGADLEKADGFAPLDQCERWLDSPVHDFPWQLGELTHSASTLLYRDERRNAFLVAKPKQTTKKKKQKKGAAAAAAGGRTLSLSPLVSPASGALSSPSTHWSLSDIRLSHGSSQEFLGLSEAQGGGSQKSAAERGRHGSQSKSFGADEDVADFGFVASGDEDDEGDGSGSGDEEESSSEDEITFQPRQRGARGPVKKIPTLSDVLGITSPTSSSESARRMPVPGVGGPSAPSAPVPAVVMPQQGCSGIAPPATASSTHADFVVSRAMQQRRMAQQIEAHQRETKNKLYYPADNHDLCIVLDAPNLCMSLGKHKAFKCEALKLALDYWKERGFEKRVALIPEQYLDFDEVARKQNQRRFEGAGSKIRASQLPDNVALLRELFDANLLSPVPEFDYDDAYCVQYARENHGVVISNDKYRDVSPLSRLKLQAEKLEAEAKDIKADLAAKNARLDEIKRAHKRAPPSQSARKPLLELQKNIERVNNLLAKSKANLAEVNKKIKNPEIRHSSQALWRWIQSHVVRYSFVHAGDSVSFMPNPTFEFPKG